MLDNGLSVITVRKEELLRALRTNRTEHEKAYAEAHAGYCEAVVKTLEEMVAEARAGTAFRKEVKLAEPQDHTKDYDRVIRMLEMSVSEQLQVTEQEFTMYVLDDWAWKGQFVATSNVYKGVGLPR